MKKHECPPKRDCRECKNDYMRKYRKDHRYLHREIATYKRNRKIAMYWAKVKLFMEVRAGRIKPPTKFRCVDCGTKAQVFDHRDYLKPLKVVPVCRSCNTYRGPGKNKFKKMNSTMDFR